MPVSWLIFITLSKVSFDNVTRRQLEPFQLYCKFSSQENCGAGLNSQLTIRQTALNSKKIH